MTTTVPLGTSGLHVPPLCLGGNVFDGTADEEASFAVLDAFVAAGGTFLDTADVCSAWLPGHTGGESERVLGRWMQARGNRDDLVVATKVASLPGREGLGGDRQRAHPGAGRSAAAGPGPRAHRRRAGSARADGVGAVRVTSLTRVGG